MKTPALFFVLAASLALHAENWPQWRGDGMCGVAPSAEAPARLSPEKNLAWKVELPGRGCSTPIVWEDRIFLTCEIDGKDGVLAVDRKGKEQWRHGNFNPKQEKNWRVIASAAAGGETAIVPFGRGGFVAGVKMGGKGDTTRTHRLWTRPGVGSDSCSPAVRDGKAYVLCDQKKLRGTLSCLNVKSGEVRWDYKLQKSVSSYFSSPTLVGDKIYCAREDGTVFCGTITAKGLTNVIENKLDDHFIASPVAVDGKLLLRGHQNLWCFE